MLYLSNGNTIYAGVAGGTLSQLLRPVNGEGFSIVSATTKGVLVNETSTDASGDKNGDLLFITPAKTYTIQAGIYDSAWSPNGQDLVVTTDSDSDIYNDRLQLIGSLPANNVTSPVWLNNNVIFYGIAGALWSYNIQTKTSNTVASVSVFGYVSKIYPSQNDAYVYVAIQNTTTNSLELSRLGLDNQPVSPIMQELQVFLPNTYQGCSLDYLDFTAPSVVVDGTDSSGQNCVQAATSYLQLYAINPASLNITTSN
jgi:hypothetical protein